MMYWSIISLEAKRENLAKLEVSEMKISQGKLSLHLQIILLLR